MLGLNLSLGLGSLDWRTLTQRAFAAIRRAGGTVLGAGAAVPVLGVDKATGPWVNNFSSAFDGFVSTSSDACTATTAGAKSNVRVGVPISGVVAGKTQQIRFTPVFTGGSVASVWLADSSLSGLQNANVTVVSGVPVAVEVPCTAATPTRVMIIFNATGASTFAITGFEIKEVTGYTYGNPPVRNYFDSAGTDILDSVTQVDQPVGLVLDGAGTVGPNLVTTPSVTGAAVDGVTAVLPYQVGVGMTVGKTYQGTYTVSGFAGTLDVGFASGAFAAVTGATRVSANGTYTFIGTAVNSDISVFTRPICNTANFSNISVRELPGNHATQATVGSKPTLRRGLVNQLRRSGEFVTNDQWTVTGLSSTPTTGPDGSTSATTLTVTNASSALAVSQITPVVASSTEATVAYILKANGDANTRPLLLRNGTTATNFQSGIFNQVTGAVTGAGWSSTALGSDWYLITFTQTSGISIGNTLLLYAGFTGGPQVLSSTFVIHRAAIFAGTVTAQQIQAAGGIPLTTTAPASSALGNYWWQFSPDAPGDFFSTGISTGATGWMCAGITFSALPPAALQVLGTTATGGLDGAGLLVATGGTSLLMSVGNGTTQHFASRSAPAVGVPAVVEGWWDSSTVTVALNGIETSAARSGVATSPGTLTIGARQVSPSAYLNGAIPVTVICPTLPPAADRALIRAWVDKLNKTL